MPRVVYGNQPETILRAEPRKSARPVNHVLLGTYLEVVEEQDEFLLVQTRRSGPGGWAHRDDVSDKPGLKVFYIDVGQGDGALIEYDGGILLIDGGPTRQLRGFLRHRYQPLIDAGTKIHIDVVVVSHPDDDHYAGFTHLLGDPDFTFGTLYHNGIIRYPGDNLPAGRDFDLGRLRREALDGRQEFVLTETIDSLDDARELLDAGMLLTKKGNPTSFAKFWTAASDAERAGRLERARRLTVREETLPGFRNDGPDKLFIQVLGPVPTSLSGRVHYVGFPDTDDMKPRRPADAALPKASSSHTRNGHSIVLKLKFGQHTFLFGGDLNIPAQLHLLSHYGDARPFEADVAKACHHGSSDFLVDFLKQVKPQANIVSSGDNKSFDHPVADAIGALARHTTGDFPLFFSTELARAVSGESIHFGLINARSNGEILTMAQMKEQHANKADVWDSFTVPWRGRFHDVLQPEGEPTPRLR